MLPSRTAISLYSGAGSLDYGFAAAGFAVRVALDHDAAAVATLRQNGERPVLEADIHDIPSREILAAAGLGIGEADVLIGGPPCQPFSKAAYWRGDTRRLSDPRAATLAAYCRVLRDTLPRAFLFENVPGLAYRGKREGLELIHRELDAINRSCGVAYGCTVAVLNAADYGVPQARHRLVVVGARDGTPFTFPAPTHGRPPLEPVRTAWDAIGDLEHRVSSALRMRGKWAGLLPSIPEGMNYRVHTIRGAGVPLFTWRQPYWAFLLKLAKDRPAWTVPAQPGPATGPFHWRNRPLSTRELCRLQTLPDTYTICGSPSAQQRQLGNAFPAALAEVVARAMRQQLFHDPANGASSLLPERRLPVPPPKSPARVPRRYLRLARSRSRSPP